MHTPDTPAPTTEKDLDSALKGTFPASDPVAATQQFTATPTADRLDPAERSADHPGTVTLYRVVGDDQKDRPFATSSGAGRWTSASTEAVYASTTPAAALLEFLVHADGTPAESAWLAKAQIPRDRITVLHAYPSTWRERPYRDDVRHVGDAWASSHQSLAAQVPSALCEETHNVLLNPAHVDAPLLQGVHVVPIRIDERLRHVARA